MSVCDHERAIRDAFEDKVMEIILPRIAPVVAEAVASERERCAKIADQYADELCPQRDSPHCCVDHARHIAQEIRSDE